MFKSFTPSNCSLNIKKCKLVTRLLHSTSRKLDISICSICGNGSISMVFALSFSRTDSLFWMSSTLFLFTGDCFVYAALFFNVLCL